MSKQTRAKQQSQKRVPAPKLRREPLPVSISVKHHLPVSADGTATDLTVAEIEAAAHAVTHQEKVDYSTSQAVEPAPATKPSKERIRQPDQVSDQELVQKIDQEFDQGDREDRRD